MSDGDGVQGGLLARAIVALSVLLVDGGSADDVQARVFELIPEDEATDIYVELLSARAMTVTRAAIEMAVRSGEIDAESLDRRIRGPVEAVLRRERRQALRETAAAIVLLYDDRRSGATSLSRQKVFEQARRLARRGDDAATPSGDAEA